MSNTKASPKNLWLITRKSFEAWNAADPFRQSAIIAYYAIFSIPSLLVIVVAVAGLVFGKEAVQGEISNQVSAAMGADTARQLEDIIAKAGERKSSIVATIIGVISLILGALGVFLQLQTSLNQIWEVKIKPQLKGKEKWLKLAKDRLFSFGLIISIGFLLLVSLVLTTALAAFSTWIKSHLPDFTLFLLQFINFFISFAIITVLFALMFKILPDARIKWKDVWIGAMVTALLFSLGKLGLGFYFGKAEPGSTYGAAGSIILVMLWVSYSCMIVFFGAEFTKQYATHFGRGIEPNKDAILIELTEEEELLIEKSIKTQRINGK
ncbi:YihY/virulence factor BrkB family protein [Emticicia sp. 21SJ11W-3]|uniref:YihY/virulence factor BrkB family protein n=1 Tax=Emticicia sp. 21SJ11W-3 TaxID=2916755 RepID=UPI0020A080B0|nr:YihY/virulence factor BrkB family protein [Emticicia sp. 21SJ11W-3]UTA69457.1 YihY/virulence factor BrkB family protein [Emticicia sp. 21SJ11W-3]